MLLFFPLTFSALVLSTVMNPMDSFDTIEKLHVRTCMYAWMDALLEFLGCEHIIKSLDTVHVRACVHVYHQQVIALE